MSNTGIQFHESMPYEASLPQNPRRYGDQMGGRYPHHFLLKPLFCLLTLNDGNHQWYYLFSVLLKKSANAWSQVCAPFLLEDRLKCVPTFPYGCSRTVCGASLPRRMSQGTSPFTLTLLFYLQRWTRLDSNFWEKLHGQQIHAAPIRFEAADQ